MRALIFAAAAAAIALAAAAHAAAPSAAITKALADTSRPEADRKADAERKSAEILALSGVKPGSKSADIFPGGGYYTRLLALAAGPKGHVYAVVPEETVNLRFKPLEPVKALAAEPAYANVTPLVQSMKSFDPPEKLDLVLVSKFYHDMHNPVFGGPDLGPVNAAVFKALKPGGVYLIIDHSAPGTGVAATNTLHRIDMEAAKREVLAAGFKLEASSDILANPADPHTANVFDPSIRGKTDQFVLKFRKPK